jgi:phospholipid-translocating P-type ATPase (flippase)
MLQELNTSSQPPKRELRAPLISDTPNTDSKTEVPRIIFVNDHLANKPSKFKKNGISTTKYNVITFIPKNLFEQFSRVANCYFLFIGLLQLIPGLSPTGRFTTFVPLSFVVLCSALKDLFEDWKRRMSDHVTNSKKTTILRDGQWQTVKWHDVQVGDIVKIVDKEPFPADIIALSTSEPQGLCYVETSSLDGETNLKIKRARPTTFHINDEETARQFNARLECEHPNNDILHFKGSLMFDDTKVPLDNEQCLLRGSTLRNTSWIIGIVVFAGHDSKLMMNQNKTPFKNSKVERMTNRFIFLLLLLEVLLCVICAVGVMIFTGSFAPRYWYFFDIYYYNSVVTPGNIVWEGFKGFWTFLILFNNLIPISLYVSIEIAKVMQGFFISKDLHMYHTETDTPATVRTSALNEELGQIEYIFSDKTGTLTCNMMEFLKFSVSGVAYGTGVTEIARAAAKREGRILVDDRPDDWDPNSEFKFYDKRISNNQWTKQPNADDIMEFINLLAVCHTVIPEKNPDNPNDVIYQASSPDEAALVKAAKYLGIEFVSRTTKDITISVLGKEEKYDILDVIEFTSSRKRMSVICRNPKGQIVLYCKGADSIIYPLLNQPQQYGDITLKHLEDFAKDGLRTLVCAKAILNENEYKAWSAEYAEAKCSFIDRDVRIEQVANKIEKNMDIVGVTAIEDKLQDGVPDTIATLAQAGIKIWVLTGDKQETAINIGFACDLLNNSMGLIILDGDSVESLYKCIQQNLDAAQSADKDNASQVLALIVDGQKLKLILENQELKMNFLRLGVLCKAVICCRVSPKQKADVVSLVKKNIQDTITLAIGDGANDVSMIQAAHVGVGISGQEGLQAANAADYAIAQFRFLKRLLLVHGRWSYRRISKLVLYCFYKNCVLYLTQFWYVFINAFSGTSIHDKWNVGLFNVLFTFLPIMALAVFDRDLKAEIAEDYPILYEQGHKNTFFNAKVFVQWTVNGIWHSFVCFIVPILSLSMMHFSDGQDFSLIGFGLVIYTSVVFVVTGKVIIETSSFTVINWLVIVFSVALWFIYLVIYSNLAFLWDAMRVRLDFPFTEFNDIFAEFRVMSSFPFWATVLLTTFIALLRDFAWKAWKRFHSRSNFVKLYYEIQYTAGRRTKEELLDNFPLEELQGLSRKVVFKRANIFDLPDVKNLLKNITGKKLSTHTGYAFSQTEGGQTEIIQQQTEKESSLTSELRFTGQILQNSKIKPCMSKIARNRFTPVYE